MSLLCHRSVRHQDFIVKITEISSDLDVKDSSWLVAPGPHGHGVVFESENFPGYNLSLSPDGSVMIIRGADAATSVFIPRHGLSGDAGSISFESAATPGLFLRHSSFLLRLHPNDGSEVCQKADGDLSSSELCWRP